MIRYCVAPGECRPLFQCLAPHHGVFLFQKDAEESNLSKKEHKLMVCRTADAAAAAAARDLAAQLALPLSLITPDLWG